MKFNFILINLSFTVQYCFAPRSYQTMPMTRNRWENLEYITESTEYTESERNPDFRRIKRRTTLGLIKRTKYKSLEEGPKRNDTYDPTFGYEPYWKDGQWVMDPDIDLNGSTTKGANCPYITCPTPFTEFGMICARNKYHENKAFDNYCAMLDIDCDAFDDWLIVYRGPCQKTVEPFKPTLVDMESRATSYIRWWYNNSPTTKFIPKTTTLNPARILQRIPVRPG